MVLANSKYHTSENDSKLRCPRGGSVRLVVSVVVSVQRLTDKLHAIRSMVYLHECRCTVAHVVGRCI